jgi:predicted secreted protein
MTQLARNMLTALLLVAVSAAPAAAETLLRLSEQASVEVQPDVLGATLRVEVDAASPAEAQSRVNAQSARALALAAKAPHVVASTGAYNVWHATQPTARWHAVQTVDLHGTDGPAMLVLVGQLQEQGMAMQGLAWRLSPEAARKAQSEATRRALSRLRARADEAAGILGLRFLEFREVRLDGSAPSPRPMPMMAYAKDARAAPPPVAQSEDIAVEASVGADAVLVQPQP